MAVPPSPATCFQMGTIRVTHQNSTQVEARQGLKRGANTRARLCPLRPLPPP